MQLSKTIYFRDYSIRTKKRSGLTIPFPDSEAPVYQAVEKLSSYRLRQILGFELYADLEKAAKQADASVAAFARALIKKNAPASTDATDGVGRVAAIQTTFRGGKGSPLHDWYPYLEGYSPAFVNSIIKEFAPNAETILDPFCGSGTTALVSALNGRTGLYSEVNPVCRAIIEAKSRALTLAPRVRTQVAERLAQLAKSLTKRLARTAPDETLRSSFESTFGARPFFNNHCFDIALRLRSLIDEINQTDHLLAQFLTVAVLRSLVSGSLLVRRGDLRFRTQQEMVGQKIDLLADVLESLVILSSDLLDAATATGQVIHICDDARRLSEQPYKVDAVITSPPYLNGTNYFRNTKIELWFLRRLTSKAGLRMYRDAAITAGINDVTLSKSVSGGFVEPELLKSILTELHADAYDIRIPLMVRSYFQEMDGVVGQLRSLCKPGATVSIDLGDSCYGKVWVPTDAILATMMEAHGFSQQERIILRERQSRDGRKLSQTLQVFKAEHTGRHTRSTKTASGALYAWTKFRETLPHQSGEMAKRNWGHSWHSMCSYQGKLKPSIARVLTAALLPSSGGRLLDPFSGVGTIPFEARLQGHTAYGFDISPAAVAISRAKLETVSPKNITNIMSELDGWITQRASAKLDLKSLEKIRFNGPLPSYFHPKTLKEIVAARAFFQKLPSTPEAAFVHACLLHILHGNRPYALSRNSHPITPFAPTGSSEYRPLMPRLADKVSRCVGAMADIPSSRGKCFTQDATGDWPTEVVDLDAIVTSPPFFDSTRFHTANWMRLWFAGWEPNDFSIQPGTFVDERQKKSFTIYDDIFRQAQERLKKGGYFAIHLGKSRKCDMAAALRTIGEAHLQLVDSFSESVDHCESHGIRDKGTVTHHQYLLFEKR